MFSGSTFAQYFHGTSSGAVYASGNGSGHWSTTVSSNKVSGGSTFQITVTVISDMPECVPSPPSFTISEKDTWTGYTDPGSSTLGTFAHLNITGTISVSVGSFTWTCSYPTGTPVAHTEQLDVASSWSLSNYVVLFPSWGNGSKIMSLQLDTELGEDFFQTSGAATGCPTMYLTAGLAPAASTTGHDNIYVKLFWGGQIPSSGLPATFGAQSNSPSITPSFALNPVTMMGSGNLNVLMDVSTKHAPDGNYVIQISAQVKDPQSHQACSASINADVTVSGGTVFISTLGNEPSEAIWLNGISSPFLISGGIGASQYSNFIPTLDQNGHLTSLQFTLTGTKGTVSSGNLTIPKSLVTPGQSPMMSIDGVPVQLASFTQDSTNYYISYKIHFSTHDVELQFTNSTTATTTAHSGNPIVSEPWFFVVPLLVVLFVMALVIGRMKKRGVKGGGVASGKAMSQAGVIQARQVCPGCGGRLTAGNSFCENCGAALDQ